MQERVLKISKQPLPQPQDQHNKVRILAHSRAGPRQHCPILPWVPAHSHPRLGLSRLGHLPWLPVVVAWQTSDPTSGL